MDKKLEIHHSKNLDWFVIYIDNRLFYAGHNISVFTWVNLFRELNIPLQTYEKNFE